MMKIPFMNEQLAIRDEKLLEIAQRRNQTIPELIDSNGVFMPRHKFVTLAVRALCAYNYTRSSTLEGVENVREAAAQHESGVPVTIISNHLSDGDHAARREALTRNGFGEIADLTYLAAGVKMIERWYIRWPAYSENRLHLPTPLDNDRLVSALNNEGLYEPVEIKTLRGLASNYKKLGLRALREAERKRDKGYIFGLYPESTRSRTGQLSAPRKETASFIKRIGSGLIVPVAIEGTERILPPETFPQFHRRARIRVVAGPLINVEKVLEFSSKQTDPDQTIVNLAMGGVAPLLSDQYISTEDRCKYATLMENFERYRPAA